MKKVVLYLLFAINIAFVPLNLIHIGLMRSLSESDNTLFLNIRITLVLLLIGFWIYLMNIWSQYDRKVVRFFLLLFFNGFYTWFYFLFAKNNGWIFNNPMSKRQK